MIGTLYSAVYSPHHQPLARLLLSIIMNSGFRARKAEATSVCRWVSNTIPIGCLLLYTHGLSRLTSYHHRRRPADHFSHHISTKHRSFRLIALSLIVPSRSAYLQRLVSLQDVEKQDVKKGIEFLLDSYALVYWIHRCLCHRKSFVLAEFDSLSHKLSHVGSLCPNFFIASLWIPARTSSLRASAIHPELLHWGW